MYLLMDLPTVSQRILNQVLWPVVLVQIHAGLDTTVIIALVPMVKQTRNSFSIIELIIVTTVVLLFSGMLLTQYGNFIEQSRLKTEANKLKDILELAKKKTIAREVANACIVGFNGYKIDVRSDGYDLSSCCGDSCTENTLIQSFTLTSQANTISITSGNETIQFVPTPAGTSLTSDTTIKLKNSSIPGTNKCLNVTVTKVGIIGVDDSFNNCL